MLLERDELTERPVVVVHLLDRVEPLQPRLDLRDASRGGQLLEADEHLGGIALAGLLADPYRLDRQLGDEGAYGVVGGRALDRGDPPLPGELRRRAARR